ncbi:unnamed protein product [Arctia plantaginis]|uniref:Uncharacterized protein n=1 Tax=Arctia plantaginis TaxID=874455 RepID=A0A8S0YXM9_ARCPL|nr:unnamed protein product [Arctia plantaginis]
MFMINVEAYMETVRNNVPLTTLVTAYPDVYDNSKLANTVRIITNIIWWIYVSRILGTYILVTPLASGLSHQYRNLCTYFYSLSEINEKQDLNQEEREDLYEKHFKLGIKMHLDTLR